MTVHISMVHGGIARGRRQMIMWKSSLRQIKPSRCDLIRNRFIIIKIIVRVAAVIHITSRLDIKIVGGKIEVEK